ncbi:uncharacterized protein LOC120430197 [Culex pipiens pallens]|uniref:uncharacterized protein LOC120430197 n=1 Tax=Culex pipiens pallens TaxID=42434 RepID=UPI001954230B|nr:uncharacterized protein LOC120430197 [Culex pipiens pallens]
MRERETKRCTTKVVREDLARNEEQRAEVSASRQVYRKQPNRSDVKSSASRSSEKTGGKSGNNEHCVIPSVAASAKKMERFSEIVHQRELAQGKLTTILESVASATTLTWATLKTCQKDVEAAYDAYHTAYGQILGMVSATLRDEQDALYDAFDDLHTEVLTVIEEKLLKVSQPTRRRNAYTPGVPQWVDETTNPTTTKIVGGANEAAIGEPQKRSGKLLAEQLDTEDRVRPEFTIPHGERSENNHKIEKPKTIIDTCKIADEKDSSHPTKKPPGQNAKDNPGQQQMAMTAGREPAQTCDVCGLGQHKSCKCPQFLVEQPGAPQQAETDQVTPEASSSGHLAPDALSAVADFRDEPCSPNPCHGLLITSKTHLTKNTLDRHNANELAGVEQMQPRSDTSMIPAGVQLAVRVNLVALRETSFSQDTNNTTGSSAARGEAVRAQATTFEDEPELSKDIEDRGVGETYKETSLVSDQTTQGRFYLLFQAMLQTSKTTLAFQAERFQGGETRCSARLQSTLLTAARTSTPHKAAAVGTQLRFDERSKHRATAAPVIMKKTKSGSGRTHPHQRSVCADPLTKRTFGAAGDGPGGNRKRCRFPTIGLQQEVLKIISRVIQYEESERQPQRLLRNRTCKYDMKLSIFGNKMKQVRIRLRNRKPPEVMDRNLPGSGQRTAIGTPINTGRQKSEIWIAWRTLAVFRGWRMFEPESVSSKKFLVLIWQHCACCDQNEKESGNPAGVVVNNKESARNELREKSSVSKLATTRR